MPHLTIREATPGELPAVAALCGRAFEKPDASFFQRTMDHDPEAKHAVTLIGTMGGQMVATVRIDHRTVRWDGRTLRLGGIANVATDPAHRGQGHAARLMERAVEVMEERGLQISLLFTDFPRVYEKAGFALWQQTEWEVDAAAVAAEGGGDLDIQEVDWRRDRLALPALHDAFDEDHTGPAIRTERHWEAMRAIFPGDDALALIAREGERAAGHLRAMVREGTLRIHEVNALDAEPLAALLAEAARRALAAGHRLRITLPPWPPIPEALESAFGAAEPLRVLGGMWRALPGGPSHTEIMAMAREGSLHFWAGDRF